MKTTYYCQNPDCSYVVSSDKLLYGEKCPCCGNNLDDWPVDAVIGNVEPEEGSYEYFNRYIAGDR